MGAARKGRRRTQEERSAETRRRLVEAAVGFICENGYAELTTTLVAERAGVSRGALQHQFGTRLDLLAAVIDHLSKEISGRMLELAHALPGREHGLSDRIDAAIRAYWSIYTSNTFIAVLNIFLGIKSDPAHYRPLQRHMLTFYQMNDEMWLKVVGDSRLSKQRLLAGRRVLFSALRGLAIGQVLGTQPKATEIEFRLIRDMFVAVLAP
ncbi:MAG TPA: TetR/AcrR family transcriptional regulator [Stellaceae bacterium]|nr:TetR/AcrR family transcriptional regulator [Stellaceae bacterium]